MDKAEDTSVCSTTSDTLIPGNVQFTGCGIKFTVKLKAKFRTTFRRKGNRKLIF